MSTEGWIFVVGFRVFDVGLLVLWLVWFFRLRDDPGDPPEDEDGGGGGGPRVGPRPGPGGGGLRLPPDLVPHGRTRLRDGHRPVPARPRRRHGLPSGPQPARVRSPGAPARVTRRSRS